MSRYRRLRVSMRSELRRRARWHNRRSRIARRMVREAQEAGVTVILDEMARFRRG